MSVVELFAGGGGVALALRNLGIEDVVHVEIDTHACATLRRAGFADVHQEDVRRWHDVVDMPVRFLWASPPCQPFSAAGKKLGADDERNLWPATFAQIDRLRPLVAVAENVPGLAHHTADHRVPDDLGAYPACTGCYFEDYVLEEWRKRFAWTAVWKLNAADYGTPQTRERLFLVGAPGPRRTPPTTHCDPRKPPDMFRQHLRPWVSMREALGLGGDASVLGKGTNPHSKGAAHERTHRQIADEPAPTVTAEVIGNAGPWVEVYESSGWTEYEGDSKHRVQDGVVRGPVVRSLDEPATTISSVPGHLRAYTSQTSERADGRVAVSRSVDEPSPTVRAQDGAGLQVEEEDAHPPWWYRASDPDGPSRAVGSKGNAQVSLATRQITQLGGGRREQYERSIDEPAPTMRPAYPGELVERPAPTVSSTRGGRGGKGSEWAVDMLEHSDRVSGTKNRRTLTVEEVGLLQDFPVDWPWQGKKRDRYRQAGNACPEKLTRAVVAAALDGEKP